MTAAAVKVQFNPHFKVVNRSRRRYRALRGSAGSGKSVNPLASVIESVIDPAGLGWRGLF